MGVTFCLLFGWWFLSGIGMLYWDYPEVDSASRLQRSPVLDPSRIQLTAAEAFARLPLTDTPERVRLNTFNRRPVYRFSAHGVEWLVYADTGERPLLSSPEMSLITASAWTGQPQTAATLEINTEEDQWTVPETFRRLRPLWKYSWPNGEQVYVSPINGEVVQYTTRASRLGAYLGPIPHWLYFTPLRKHSQLWSGIVIWLSGLATIAALLGLLAGTLLVSPSKRYRHQGMPSSIPYAGQKRWHMTLGLFFGVMTCTWCFSGMLSMDPFSIETGDSGAAEFEGALRGQNLQLNKFSVKPPQLVLAQIAPELQVRELEFTNFAGEATYLATDGKQNSRIIPVSGAALRMFDTGRLMQEMRTAALPAGVADLRLITQYDAYYLDRQRQKPLPVILAQLNDPGNTRYYVDPRTASVVSAYNSRSWVDRWLYHALHSFDLPWLYNYRPAWDGVMLTLLAGGTALSFTSIVLGYRSMRRKPGKRTISP